MKKKYGKQPGKTLFIDARNMGTMVSRRLREMTGELSELFTKSHTLEAEIKERLEAIGYEI